MKEFEGKQKSPIAEQQTVAETIKNFSIALSLEDILKNKGIKRDNYKSLTLREKENPSNMIDIATYSTRKTRFDCNDVGKVPRCFSFPVYVIFLFAYSDQPLNTTRYGLMPESAIAPDRFIYYFNNIYFFNRKGEAVKHEKISKGFSILDPRMKAEENEHKEIDFIPLEKDSRYLKLNRNDYARIKEKLKLIQAGKVINQVKF